FYAAMIGFLALIAVDFMFLLPLLFALAIVAVVAAAIVVALCGVGLALVMKLFSLDHGLSLHYLTRILTGVGLLGLGVGGGALLLMMIDYVVRLLGKFARLHYELLNQADSSAA